VGAANRVQAGRLESSVPGLGESKREQARAKQHQTGRGYCEESFGYEIIMTHDAPADRDAEPNLLKLSESLSLQHRPRTIAFISVRNENAGADEAEKYCNHLDHRNCPSRPWKTETTGGAAQSKGFRAGYRNPNPTDDLEQHCAPERGPLSPVCGSGSAQSGQVRGDAEAGRGRPGKSGCVGPLDHVIHGRHDGRSLPLAIEFGKPVDEQAQGLRNFAGLFVEKDTKPVADFIADGAAVPAVYPRRKGFLARHDSSPNARFRGTISLKF
jgi:hypothetical protein